MGMEPIHVQYRTHKCDCSNLSCTIWRSSLTSTQPILNRSRIHKKTHRLNEPLNHNHAIYFFCDGNFSQFFLRFKSVCSLGVTAICIDTYWNRTSQLHRMGMEPSHVRHRTHKCIKVAIYEQSHWHPHNPCLSQSHSQKKSHRVIKPLGTDTNSWRLSRDNYPGKNSFVSMLKVRSVHSNLQTFLSLLTEALGSGLIFFNAARS